jgi:hypothetical protein
MNYRSCFIDTTILAEALLKARENRSRARTAIRQYKRSVLPVYAIKEWQYGALKNFIWLHNKLADTRSFSRTIRAIHKNFRKPYMQGTLLEALELGAEMLIGSDLSQADTPQKTQLAMADSARLHIRRRIDAAWRERRKLTTEVFEELPCFPDNAHSFNEETKYIDSQRQNCDLQKECCLADGFRARRGDLHKLLTAIKDETRLEDKKRRTALHLLLKRPKPKKPFDDANCRALGDAYFALQCPQDCAILTSNFKDLERLGGALRKEAHQYKVP